MRVATSLVVSVLVPIALPAPAQQFFPPSAVNNGWNTDSAPDQSPRHVVDEFNRVHAVWASQVDYPGDAGTDWDIFYAMFTGNAWTDPVLVNSYGKLDSAAAEGNPRIAIDSNGRLHVVWESTFPFAGTGNDTDIFYSQNTGSGWSAAQKVNHYADTDNPAPGADEDIRPAIAVRGGSTVLVAWNSRYDSPGTLHLGTDADIFYSIRIAGTWTPAEPVNSNAATDIGNDLGVSVAVSRDGDFIAVWHTNDDFNPPPFGVGTDTDIAYSILPPTGSWSTIEEVAGLARTDTGDDLWPEVASTGQGFNTEFHVVWQSREPAWGSGTDEDILHTVIPALLGSPDSRPAWLVNNTGVIDGPGDSDLLPRLCIEPGGVVHCIWDSSFNVYLSGTDADILHSSNATHGNAWSPVDLVNLTGLIDPGEHDFDASIGYAPNGYLTAMWMSTHDLQGQAGPDTDILATLGWSRLVSRPEPVNFSATFDNPAVALDADTNVSIALSPAGTLHAVWASNFANPPGLPPTGSDFDIYHATLGPEGWGQPDLVNVNGETDAGSDLFPFAAVDSNGTVHVVWSSDENIGGTLGTDADLLYARSSSPGAWSSPQAVNSGAIGDSLDDVAGKLVIDSSDRPHAIWMSDFGPGSGGAIMCNLSYSRRDSLGWTDSEYVNAPFATPPSSFNSATDFAIRQGFLYVVWESDADYNGAGTDDDIFFSHRIGGAWTAPVFVNDAASDGAEDRAPTLAFDQFGWVHVVWQSNLDVDGAGPDDDLFYSYLQGGATWATARLLLTSGRTDTGDDRSPEMVFDRDGTLHVVWTSDQPLRFGAAGADFDIFYTTIEWPTDLPTTRMTVLANPSGYADTGEDAGSMLVIDEDGYVHFSWTSDDTMGGYFGSDLDCFHSRTNVPITFRSAGATGWELYR